MTISNDLDSEEMFKKKIIYNSQIHMYFIYTYGVGLRRLFLPAVQRKPYIFYKYKHNTSELTRGRVDDTRIYVFKLLVLSLKLPKVLQ